MLDWSRERTSLASITTDLGLDPWVREWNAHTARFRVTYVSYNENNCLYHVHNPLLLSYTAVMVRRYWTAWPWRWEQRSIETSLTIYQQIDLPNNVSKDLNIHVEERFLNFPAFCGYSWSECPLPNLSAYSSFSRNLFRLPVLFCLSACVLNALSFKCCFSCPTFVGYLSISILYASMCVLNNLVSLWQCNLLHHVPLCLSVLP